MKMGHVTWEGVKTLRHYYTTDIVIIDRHPIFRTGLKHLLQSHKKFIILGEAVTEKEGFQLVQRMRPNLVVTEMWLAEQNTADLIRNITWYHPGIRVVVMTMYPEIPYAIQAFCAGAIGFFSKETDPDIFLEGCESVMKAERCIDPAFSSEALSTIQAAISTGRKATKIAGEHLTPREKEVIRLVAEGTSRREIASALCISPKTLENHISRVMKKLSLRNSIELIRWAAGKGMVNLDIRIGKPNYGQHMEALAYNQ